MADTVQITLIRNPFDPHGSRVILPAVPVAGRSVKAIADAELARLGPALTPAFGWEIGVDGALVTDRAGDIIPRGGQSVAVCPCVQGGGGGGSSVGRTIAMLAVMVAAVVTQQYYLAAYGSTVTTAAGVTSYTTGSLVASGIAGAAVAGVGSMAVNALLPPVSPDLSGFSGPSLDDTPTYGWDTADNQAMNGGALPVLYGRMRVTPYLIGKHVSTDGDKQYLNLLYAVAGHEVDAIHSVEVNGSPAGEHVEVETRLGTPGQDMVSNFSDTVFEQSGGMKLSAEWSTVLRTDGNAVQGLAVGLSCPAGLFRMGNGDALESETIRVEVQHRRVGTSTWLPLAARSITAAVRAAVRRVLRIDHLIPDRYEVRVRFASAPASGTRHVNDTYFDYLQEIVYDDFAYPGVALLGVRALATDQLSGGMPRITCVAERSAVRVWRGGEWETRPANNPAWATYDALVNADYGGAVAPERMALEDFDRWAAFCDEHDLRCTLIYEDAMGLPAALAHLGHAGRGRVVQRGTQFGCQFDGPDLPVYTFNVGNIVADTFSEDYLAMKDRANVIEVTFWDETRRWQRTAVEVRGPGWAGDDGEERKMSMTLYAVTRREQAVRYARFLLNCNRWLRRTVRFEAALDGWFVQPGDLIRVQHDLPQWGHGGRVTGGTATHVELDAPVALAPDVPYRVCVVHADDSVEELTVITPPGEVAALDVAEPFAQVPADGERWVLGEMGKVGKLFRVTDIRRTQEMRARVTALEYRAEVYDDAGPVPEYEQESALAAVAGLSAAVFDRVEDAVQKKRVSLSWRGAAIRWQVFQRRVGEPWQRIGETQVPSYDVDNLQVGFFYDFAVSPSGNPGDGQVVPIDYRLNMPAGPVRPVTELVDGTEIVVTELVDGVETTTLEVI